MTKRFYKEKSRWYIDLPSWPGPKSALEMVSGADDLLNRLSDNGNEVKIKFSTRKIRDYDDVLDRVAKMSELKDNEGKSLGLGKFDGAIYEVRNKPIKNEIIEANNLWLCGVTLFVFLRYPKTIYFKVV